MRFKFDENLPREMAALFAEAGHDAVTVIDQQMSGEKDQDIAAVCLNEGRALVTLDLDFSDIRVYPPQRYPGLVVLRVSSQLREDLLEVGVRLLENFTSSLQGQLWIVDDSRIRIRE